jgi:hypothetical protein
LKSAYDGRGPFSTTPAVLKMAKALLMKSTTYACPTQRPWSEASRSRPPLAAACDGPVRPTKPLTPLPADLLTEYGEAT